MLDIHDDLIRQKISVSENWPVVIVGFVVRIVTPRREPISRVEIVIPGSNQNEGCEMAPPPKTGVPRVLISAKSFRVSDEIDWSPRWSNYRRHSKTWRRLRSDVAGLRLVRWCRRVTGRSTLCSRRRCGCDCAKQCEGELFHAYLTSSRSFLFGSFFRHGCAIDSKPTLGLKVKQPRSCSPALAQNKNPGGDRYQPENDNRVKKLGGVHGEIARAGPVRRRTRLAVVPDRRSY